MFVLVSPVWCCACAVSGGRSGLPTAWPELCTRSSSPRSLHHPPTQTETENKAHSTDVLSLHHWNNYKRMSQPKPDCSCVYDILGCWKVCFLERTTSLIWQSLLGKNCVFCVFEPFPTMTVWFWDPSFHTEDNRGTHIWLLQKVQTLTDAP